MKTWPLTRFVSMLVLGCMVFQCHSALGNDHAQEVLGKFRDRVAKDEKLSDEIKASVKATLKESDDDPQYAITEGLVLLYPNYGSAIESSDENQVAQAIEKLTPMSKSDDPFLAADASFTLARMLMNNERFEAAMPLLEKLGADMGDFTAHRGAAQYYIGVAQAGLLDNKAAIESFMRFLQFNRDAPERLVVSAWRQVQELQSIQQGQLNDVYQRMDYSRRRLDLQETGEKTQEEQEKIVQILSKLIKEAEKKECSNCKGGKCKDPKPGAKSAQSQKPGKSQKGGSSSNANGEAIVKNYEDGPTSAWSRLRDRSRDPANNAVKEKLPPRYREIFERFIKAANGEEK